MTEHDLLSFLAQVGGVRQDGQVIQDYDFHPRDEDVRVFDIPQSGVLVADDDVFVCRLLYADGIVWHHYAFRDHWFKVNVTTDLTGALVETAPAPAAPAYAYTIDLATPMRREGDEVYAVDLEVDVLVKRDGSTYTVIDLDEFQRSIRRGLISPAETEGVRHGLDHLVELIETERLYEFLAKAYPLGPPAPTTGGTGGGGESAVPAPPAPALRRVPLEDVPHVQPGKRLTWTGESKA